MISGAQGEAAMAPLNEAPQSLDESSYISELNLFNTDYGSPGIMALL